ncbi:MAG: M56 family metallopeptidase, partial [Bacillota bacterium]
NIDLEFILKHELVHYKRCDLWLKLLLISANALHWFNPIVYRMVREANKDIEISCDEEVLKGADLLFRKRYSERILDLMQGNNYQDAPVSTSFHGGKGMLKSRIQNIFDERVKKKGVLSFLSILALVILFSACQFDIGQNEWKILYQRTAMSVSGLDDKGNPIKDMDGTIILSYDINGDGKNETKFSLIVSENGKDSKLEYKNDEDGKIVQTTVFKDADPGVDYSIQAANLEDENSIFILVSIDYHGMPLGSGYWELYKWKDGAFKQVDLKSVQENLQMKILTHEEAVNNSLKADVIAYLYDSAEYPANYPVAALYFKDELKNGKTPGSVDYASMSEYDAEGFENWGQEAIGKIMSSMNMVNSNDIEGYKGPSGHFLETEEYVYITLPNITATVKQYYQYKDGKWSRVDGYIK